MDLLTGAIGPMYRKYLAAAFGSALITSVYSIVDMAMVGQYHGPEGTAALAVVAPIWNIIYSLGLLTGIGGSVLFSTLRGRPGSHRREEGGYFTAAVLASLVLSGIAWAVVLWFQPELLRLFGADDALLPLAQAYLKPIQVVLPLFLLNQMLSAFLRNDGNPMLATVGVLAGGAFNVVGDYLFVFTLDMGIYGAGLATALGAALSFGVLMTHFLSKKNTLRLVWPEKLPEKWKAIVITGFSTFFIDLAMGILTVLFNRQIMTHLGTDALAVYGVIVNVSTFVQCCGYSVGQAAQPMISINFGAGEGGRIRTILRCALYTATAFGLFWTGLSLAVPEVYIAIFMEATPGVQAIAPGIIRMYSLSFLLLPLNVFSTYYFQALMKPRGAFLVSVLRGCVISGGLILLLPGIAGPDALWLAMPLTEGVVAVYAIWGMIRCTRHLTQ